MEFLMEYGLFLAKAITFVVVVAVIAGIVTSLGQRHRKGDKGHIEVLPLNEFNEQMHSAVKEAVLDSEQHKAECKKQKQADKDKQKKRKQAQKKGEQESRKRVFVLTFDGDIQASAVSQLRQSITAVLAEATDKDEVVLKLQSPGGAVHSYGLAASQLDRIRKKGIPLTVCVDQVAASGGYMMACVGDRILSAPFAMIGSIGVIGQLPNFNKLLKKHDVEFEQHTAGDFKRTLTMLGENTDADREKFRQDLEAIHQQFKAYVAERRPNLDIEQVATGEVWLGSRSLELGLVDEVLTSDEYLTGQLADADLYEVSFVQKKNIQEKLGLAAQSGVERGISRWWQKLNSDRFYS
ncbi:MAG: protease SohB [Porticoccaceae bacterium]|nr:protease SohB [Porticoccaceae bacterium]